MNTARSIARVVLALFMSLAGVMHFVRPEPFVRIVPAVLPAPLLIVYISGVFELLLGVGLLVPRVRRIAAFGLVLLLIAVFPANVNMAVHRIALDNARPLPDWALWGRLPLQALFIGIALWVRRVDDASKPPLL